MPPVFDLGLQRLLCSQRARPEQQLPEGRGGQPDFRFAEKSTLQTEDTEVRLLRSFPVMLTFLATFYVNNIPVVSSI